MIHVPNDKLILEILALLVALVAAVIDVRTTLIPNRLTFPSTLVALILRTIFGGWGMAGLLDGLIGAVLGVFITYATGGWNKKMWFGDSKLMMAMGAFLGWGDVLLVMLYFSIAWGLIAAYRIGRVVPWKLIFGAIVAKQAGGNMFTPEDAKRIQGVMKSKIPIGPAIAAGVLLAELLRTQTLEFMGFIK